MVYLSHRLGLEPSMGIVVLRRLGTALRVEPGIWFFAAFTCLLTLGYLNVMSRMLAIG